MTRRKSERIERKTSGSQPVSVSAPRVRKDRTAKEELESDIQRSLPWSLRPRGPSSKFLNPANGSRQLDPSTSTQNNHHNGPSITQGVSGSSNGKNKCDTTGNGSRRPKARRQSRSPPNGEIDSYARCLSRAKMHMGKIKREELLLLAYQSNGWNGSSRDKVKPTAEVDRAGRQIEQSKNMLRECLRYCDAAQGDIAMPQDRIEVDGQPEFDAIACSKCQGTKSDGGNDIVMCDGGCNLAYHEKCLNPPIKASLIPREESWFCPACVCKEEIISMINEAFDVDNDVHAHVDDVLFATIESQTESDTEQDLPPPQHLPPDFLTRELSDSEDDEDYRDEEQAGPPTTANAPDPANESFPETDMQQQDEPQDTPAVFPDTDIPQNGTVNGDGIHTSVQPRTGAKRNFSAASESLANGHLDGPNECGSNESGRSNELANRRPKRRKVVIDYRALNISMFGDKEVDGDNGGEYLPRRRARA